MKKFLLIASVAAMAVTAPAQAQRDDRGKRGEQAEQNQQRAERKAARQQQQKQQQASDRGARQQQAASERRAARQQQVSDRRADRQQQVSDRRSRVEQLQSDRRAQRQQVQSERRSRLQQAQSDRRSRVEQAQPDRRAQRQQVEADRRAQRQQIQSDRRSRLQQAQSDRRSRLQQVQSDRRSRIDQLQSDRRSRIEQLQSDRRSLRQQAQSDRRSLRQQVQSDRRAAFTGDDGQWRQQAWQRRAERTRVLAERRERLSDRQRTIFRAGDDDDRRSFFRVGQRVERNWWYDDYVPLRYASYFDDDDNYYYRYDGDYLYRLNRDNDVVLSLFPLLGGAYAVGSPLPFYQSSFYNVPWGYDSLYYDTPSSYYRYGDSAIYRVDPTTQLIAGIVALLTGQNLGIGQMLPTGYDVYNVPYAYRDNYYDSSDQWYRYDDGYIYGVDPYTRMIESRYPVYGDYTVGQPWPSYAGYDYGVPDYYGDLYYDQPNYDYRFASGGIYQVDPTTQLVTALVALVTGQNFAVGQPMPLGYDAYNVPYAFRDDYYDNDDNWYRYADGRIYQLDPDTRLIRRVIMV